MCDLNFSQPYGLPRLVTGIVSTFLLLKFTIFFKNIYARKTSHSSAKSHNSPLRNCNIYRASELTTHGTQTFPLSSLVPLHFTTPSTLLCCPFTFISNECSAQHNLLFLSFLKGEWKLREDVSSNLAKTFHRSAQFLVFFKILQ